MGTPKQEKKRLGDKEVEVLYAVIHEERAANELLQEEVKKRVGAEDSGRFVSRLKKINESLAEAGDDLLGLRGK